MGSRRSALCGRRLHEPGAFALAEKGSAAAIRVDAADWPGVQRAAHDLQADVNRVTGITPAWDTPAHKMVLIGTVGKSPLIDQLARAGKIDVNGIRGKWESFFLQTVTNPLPGVESALVIAGSDKRGHDLRHLRPLRANRRLALVLVGRRHPRTQIRALRSPRQISAG